MYSVTVRESVMIAHSLQDPSFGAAQNLHGATYVVDAEFIASALNNKNVVVDIVAAKQVLADVLDAINYKNLDELDEFDGELTTAEFVAQHIHDAMQLKVSGFFDGRIRIRIRETHDAWVSYESGG